MNYTEARQKFIQAWGTLGSSWGINRTMAQIHALLLLAPEPIDTDEIMDELKISRGNANMNVRSLIDWGLVYKETKAGDRKEYFIAEKDTSVISRQVAAKRRQQELVPVLRLLSEFKSMEADKNDKPAQELKKVTDDLAQFAGKADVILEKFTQSDEHWLMKLITKMM